MKKKSIPVIILSIILFFVTACGISGDVDTDTDMAAPSQAQSADPDEMETEETDTARTDTADSSEKQDNKEDIVQDDNAAEDIHMQTEKVIEWDETWEYASSSKLHTDSVKLYYAEKDRRGFTVAVNAGHGTENGSTVKTMCHPDGSPKVTGGSTEKGALMAPAVSGGTTLLDGVPEKSVTLELARIVKEEMLNAGYDVLMIRENEDVQLDNIARTVFANNNADCHISFHYDSTENDKGLFYISVPDVASYKRMEPVASHWTEHQALGEAVLSGMKKCSIPVYSGGSVPLDLTQTSYSTIPSIDLEVGDRASDHSRDTLMKITAGLIVGLEEFIK